MHIRVLYILYPSRCEAPENFLTSKKKTRFFFFADIEGRRGKPPFLFPIFIFKLIRGHHPRGVDRRLKPVTLMRSQNTLKFFCLFYGHMQSNLANRRQSSSLRVKKTSKNSLFRLWKSHLQKNFSAPSAPAHPPRGGGLRPPT